MAVWAGVSLSPLAAFGADPAEAAPAAKPPSLLDEAFNKWMNDQGRWAYTESQRVTGFNQQPKGETLLRVDPSQTYPEQFKPFKVEGQEPTEKQVQQYRGRGEWLARRRKQAEDDAREHSADEIKLNLNGQVVMPDLKHATVLTEDEKSVTYEVPLHKSEKDGGQVFDKFQLSVRVNKQRRDFERATIRQRTSMRVQLVIKVTETELEFEFTSVDPRFPSTITKETQHATIGVLFVKRVVSAEVTRTDLKHVTPYDERFGVKFGPIRTIQF